MTELVEEYRDAYICDLCHWGSCIITRKQGHSFITDPFRCPWENVAIREENPSMQVPRWRKTKAPIRIKILKGLK